MTLSKQSNGPARRPRPNDTLYYRLTTQFYGEAIKNGYWPIRFPHAEMVMHEAKVEVYKGPEFSMPNLPTRDIWGKRHHVLIAESDCHGDAQQWALKDEETLSAAKAFIALTTSDRPTKEEWASQRTRFGEIIMEMFCAKLNTDMKGN